MDSVNEQREDRPLWLPVPLTHTRERRRVRRPRHWALFAAATLIGFTPMLIGVYYGLSAVSSVGSGSVLPWWGIALGLLLLLVCLGGMILTAYAITEVDVKALCMSLAFALLAWPGVATIGFVLTYVAPDTPMQVELCNDNPKDKYHCIWN